MTAFTTKKISRVKSLGTILKNARTRREISLDDAERATKICQKYLVALEEGHYEVLPAEAYNIGFVRTYATFLKLKPEVVIDQYRRERSNYREQPTMNKSVAFSPQKAGEWRFLITPKILAGVGTFLLFGSLVAYIGIQLNRYAQPPVLVMANNATELTSTKDTIKLQGKTSAGASLLMNAEPIAVGSEGTFTQDVQLAPGLNEFTIQAKNRVQKESKVSVKVLFTPDLAKAP